MRRLACMLLVFASVGCAPVTVPEAQNGFVPIGEGAADILGMKARALRAEVNTLRKECASLEKRRAVLMQEADGYRSRAVSAKRSQYLSASLRNAKFDLWTDIAVERDRQVKACDQRQTSMTAQIMFLEMQRQRVLHKVRQAEDAVVPGPG